MEILEIIKGIQEFFNSNLASIVSISSVIIALLAFIETKRSRKSSYHPDIVIPSTNVFMRKEESNDKEGYVWNTTFYKIIDKEEKKNIGLQAFPLNIGLGVSKNIKIKWDFNLKKLIDECNKFSSESIQVHHHDYGKGLEIITLDSSLNSDISFCGATKMNHDNDDIDYLIPIHHTQNSNKYLSLPESLILAYFTFGFKKYGIGKNRKTDFNFESFLELPKATMEIVYLDVQNNKHSKTFELHIEGYEIFDQQNQTDLPFYLNISFIEIQN